MKAETYTPAEDAKMIDDAFQELLNGYLASNHRKKVEIIKKAFDFARSAHSGIRRRSGEPYILHPIAVARIVSHEMGLGSTSICSALLHDVVEDTDYTVEDIEAQFGPKIAQIVEGLTKISGGKFGEKASLQAENFRKLLLSMSNDVRVVLIKMADRLHNMRTLGSMLPSKQYKIAGETLYVYAPLAHRLGLFSIKTELENLSFKYEHPDAYEDILQKIANTEEKRNAIFDTFAAPIKERLNALGLKYTFKVRVKSAYSIWNKMQTKHVPFEEVYDLYAGRIVFEGVSEADEKRVCWSIYSEITDLYRLHPDRTRDWLSTPKANGYRALHLTVMGPDGNWIEVQIRSERMDDMAERGFAAHWKYKIGEGEEESELSAWLSTIEDILKNPEPNALDFLDTIKMNLFSSEIVVFTPKGELVTLPKDASVLDLAFHLHTEIGIHCIAGKVNHKLVPLSYKLSSGDQVEVLTSYSQQPQNSWENYLVTAKGKTRLRAALRRDYRKIAEDGERRFRQHLADNGIEYSNLIATKLVGTHRLHDKEELFFHIGKGDIVLDEALIAPFKGSGGRFKRLFRIPFTSRRNADEDTVQPTVSTVAYKKNGSIDQSKTYVLRTHDGKPNYVIPPCCTAIPGDDVVGFVNEQENVEVHKLTCPKVAVLKTSFGGRLLQTVWEGVHAKFRVKLEINGIDRRGVLQEIVYIISTTMEIDMRTLNITEHEGLFHCHLEVMIEDSLVVTRLMKRIKAVNGVQKVARVS